MSDKNPSPANSARDYDLDDFVDVDSVARLKAIADPLRLYLTDLVLERAMSVTELAERVDRPRGTIAYHVDQLVDAGLLKVVRTRRVRAVEERFYGRVARTMVYPEAARGNAALPFLDLVLDDYDRALLDELFSDDGSLEHVEAALGTYRRARIPADRASEYARRLFELTMEFVDEPREGDIEFGMYVMLFPTRRSAGATPPESDDDRVHDD